MEKEEDRTITGKIPKSYKKEIEGNKIKIIVKKPKDPDIDVVPILVKNGKEYEEKNISDYSSSEKGETEKGSNGGTSGGGLREEQNSDKKKLGKAIKRGTIAGLAALLLIGILTSKDVEITKSSIPSDKSKTESVSDLYPNPFEITVLSDKNGEDLVVEYNGGVIYLPSQTQDPGKIISDLRERAISESLGRHSGRQAYDSIPEEDRIKEEEKINEISKKFGEELSKIAKAGQVLKDESSTLQEKQDALKAIRERKK